MAIDKDIISKNILKEIQEIAGEKKWNKFSAKAMEFEEEIEKVFTELFKEQYEEIILQLEKIKEKEIEEKIWKGFPNHRGRPGKVGGSLPKEGASSSAGKPKESGGVESVITSSAERFFKKNKINIKEFEDAHIIPGLDARMRITPLSFSDGLFIDIEYYPKGYKGDDNNKVQATMSIHWKGKEDCHYDFIRNYRQDSGMLKEFMVQQEAYLKKVGFKQMSLLADISVGRYAWAKMGFEMSHEDLIERKKTFKEFINDNIDMHGEKFAKQMKDKDIFKKINSVKTALDLANIGRDIEMSASRWAGNVTSMDVADKTKLHLGKAFMLSYLNEDWDGIRIIK